MKPQNRLRSALSIALAISLLAGVAFAGDDGKIPITTSSAEARKLFLQGRDLNDRLQGQEALQYFEKAVAADPNFTQAYLLLAFVQPSAKGFFDTFASAKNRVDEVSAGERLWILGVEAGFSGFPMKQREYYRKLVELHPQDERAHTLLGNSCFGQQEYALAIEAYEKATAIAPEFSPPYNALGYAHRFLGDYDSAKKAFKKYIELIPNDPNPHDSYAELLMKMGDYDASIESYRKALTFNPNFVASHIGIATNLNFKGEHLQGREQLEKLYAIARNNGERRAALFAMAVSFVDAGHLEKALAKQEEQLVLAEAIDDAAAMAGDLVTMGNILLEMEKADAALAKYQRAMEVVQTSDLTAEVKDNNQRGFLFNAARVAIKKNDLTTARIQAAKFRHQIMDIDNPFQTRLAHELTGQIALAANDPEKALTELRQANQQNPYNLYRMARACQAGGDLKQAVEWCEKAAQFNALNNLNYAFIRHRAQQYRDQLID